MSLRGGCQCGAIRYEIQGAIKNAAYCHCRMCQRATGAPVTAWFTVKRDQFSLSQGKLAGYHSSQYAIRGFCAGCGTPLTFATSGDEEDTYIDVLIATLDEPGQIQPKFHIFTASRIPWFDTADTLPRHRERSTS